MLTLGVMVTTTSLCFTKEKRMAVITRIEREAISQAPSQKRELIHSLMMSLVWLAQIHFMIRPFLTVGFKVATAQEGRGTTTLSAPCRQGVHA